MLTVNMFRPVAVLSMPICVSLLEGLQRYIIEVHVYRFGGHTVLLIYNLYSCFCDVVPVSFPGLIICASKTRFCSPTQILDLTVKLSAAIIAPILVDPIHIDVG